MAELDYLVLADGVMQRPDGKLDLYGAGFDTIYAPNVPAQHGPLAIAMRVYATDIEMESAHSLDLVLMSEDGPEIARAHADVEPATDEMRDQLPAGDRFGIGIAMTLNGLIFPSYGRYHLAVLFDGTEMRQPVRLRVSPIPASPG